MIIANIYKGRMAIIFLLLFYIPQFLYASPLFSDIKVTGDISPDGGSLMAEDPQTGISVGLFFPKGSLSATKNITLVIHGSTFPKVLGRTHINGISVLPEGLLLLEKASLQVYNPPVDVSKSMILYRIVNQQFIIPLGSQVQHEDEGWIEGTFYITGRFSLGTPTAAEISAQSKKLAAYNPASSLAYTDTQADTKTILLAENSLYDYPFKGGPCYGTYYGYSSGYESYFMADEECLRWQKTLTKVEAHLTWVEQHKWTGNTEGERTEQANAEKALQDAINEYLKKPPPENKCGSYIKAAAKYLESAILLGMDTGGNSPIAKHFSSLVDECSFVFTVERHEWINHPRETLSDGATQEEKSNWYGTIKCFTPWNEFIATGTQKIRGEGSAALHYENHWIGDEKNDHTQTDASFKVDKIEGAVMQYLNDHGEQTMLANISIYWTKNVTTRIWGKNPMGPYDKTGSSTESYVENKSYPLENGYSENIGNKEAGMSIRVFIVKSPGDGRDNPDYCF